MTTILPLQGKVIKELYVRRKRGEDALLFVTDDNIPYIMYHEQDCCESVYIEDICGDLNDLLGCRLNVVTEETDRDCGVCESYTWTFYKFATIKGDVDMRWYGASNGYYSERVDLISPAIKQEYSWDNWDKFDDEFVDEIKRTATAVYIAKATTLGEM